MPTLRPFGFLLVFAVLSAPAQTPSPSSYDAVSIRPHDPADANRRYRTLPDGITMVGITLQTLASMAYDVKPDFITGGPSWFATKGFDVNAKVLPADDGKTVQLSDGWHADLLRALLVDRFHLLAHVETKTLPVYDLVLAKGGVKMQAAPAPPPQPDSPTVLPDLSKKPRGLAEFGDGFLRATSCSVPLLIDQLGSITRRTVVDRTGLTGYFDLDLEYNPPGHPGPDNAADPKPDIFTALQEQLGLQLVPTKGPVKTLVIDHAELPTAN